MSSAREVDYDALEATTKIEDITNDEVNQGTLRSLRDDDGDLSYLYICGGEEAYDHGDYRPKSSEELGWLGHFAKKSAHLEEFGMCERDAFYNNCSQQSIDRFFEDIGKCNRIRKFHFDCIYDDLTEIIRKLDPAIKNNNITHLCLSGCYLGETDVNHIFNVFRDDMKGLEDLSIQCDDDIGHDLDDDIMAGCIPSLVACANVRRLTLTALNMSNNSCAALSSVFTQMTALRELDLANNSIRNDGAEVLVRGLAECKYLHSVSICRNRISDDGLKVLFQGLPTSVNTLFLNSNQITLAQHLPLLRFKELDLSGNTLSSDGPRVIAASLADPECRLEALYLNDANIVDEEATVLASSLWNNQRLTCLSLEMNGITYRGWNVFSSVLCDTKSINATHGSNHALQRLGYLLSSNVPKDVETLLYLNRGQDKNLVAATKILQTHRHLDMRALFDAKLLLLPHVVAWLERFAESQLDLKLSSIYEFARAMPMEVVDGVAGEKKGKKRMHSSA